MNIKFPLLNYINSTNYYNFKWSFNCNFQHLPQFYYCILNFSTSFAQPKHILNYYYLNVFSCYFRIFFNPFGAYSWPVTLQTSKFHLVFFFPLPFHALFFFQQHCQVIPKVIHIWFQACFFVILNSFAVSIFLHLLLIKFINLPKQLRDRRDVQWIEAGQGFRIDWYTDLSRAGMYNKRRLEQMYLLFADLDIEPGVSVLEHDVLFCFQESFPI